MKRVRIDGMTMAALALCALLAVFLASFFVKFLLRHTGGTAVMAQASNGAARAVEVDWAALYPYETTAVPEMDDTVSVTAAKDATPGALAAILDGKDRYIDGVNTLESAVEAYVTDDVILHDTMVEAANAYDRLLGWEINAVGEYNGLVTLGDGYLGTSFPAQDMTTVCADVASFAAYCEQQALPMLYVQLPFKIASQDTGVSGVADFANQNADALLEGLATAGVNVLDMRIPLALRQQQRGATWHSAFFRTDHHWLPETGLWAAGVVAQRLNDDYGFGLDLASVAPEGFHAEVYEDWFLGAQGKKATLAAAKPEDFSLLYPTKEASLGWRVPSLSIERQGGFSILYQYELLGERSYYEDSPYTAYFYGDVALKSLDNLDRPKGPRLLVIQDSFANVMTPFLALGAGGVDALDLRYFTGSLETFLRQRDYDGVVVAYSIDLLGYDDAPKDSPSCWHNFR